MSLKQRLPPANGSRVALAAFAAEAAKAGNGPEFRVLDAGAGAAPFRDLFAHVSYETADFAQESTTTYTDLDYVCDLAEIPVADSTFDLVLSSQVLEHIPEPRIVMAEFARILKPGGTLWMTAPLFYEEHQQPYDFNRYTQFAWWAMAAEAGLEIRELEWLEGYYETVAYQCTLAAKSLPGKASIPVRALFLLLAHWYARAERRRKVTTSGMPKNYRCVMVKP